MNQGVGPNEKVPNPKANLAGQGSQEGEGTPVVPSDIVPPAEPTIADLMRLMQTMVSENEARRQEDLLLKAEFEKRDKERELLVLENNTRKQEILLLKEEFEKRDKSRNLLKQKEVKIRDSVANPNIIGIASGVPTGISTGSPIDTRSIVVPRAGDNIEAPSVYNNSRKDDAIEEWISTVKGYFDSMEKSGYSGSEEIKISYVTNLLSGEALAHFRLMEECAKGRPTDAGAQINTVEDVFQGLRCRFTDITLNRRRFERYETITQTGSANAFCAELLGLVMKLRPTPAEDETRRRIRSGLKYQVRMAMIGVPGLVFDTYPITDLVNLAVEFDEQFTAEMKWEQKDIHKKKKSARRPKQ